MLILVRHGRTELNAWGRLQGRIDEPLDDVGLAQAAAVAAHVGPVDELICSPLERARQTAAAFDQPFVIDDRWIELSYGVLDGTELMETPRELWEQWRSDPNFAPDGGESLVAVADRVCGALDELADRARSRTIAVVSHVSPIKAAVAWALDAPVEMSWRTHLSVASICRIDVRDSGPVLTSFNELASRPAAASD